MYITPSEYKAFLMHRFPKLTPVEAQDRVDTFLRWLSKHRSVRPSTVDSLSGAIASPPQHDLSIRWRGRTPQEIQAIHSRLVSKAWTELSSSAFPWIVFFVLVFSAVLVAVLAELPLWIQSQSGLQYYSPSTWLTSPGLPPAWNWIYLFRFGCTEGTSTPLYWLLLLLLDPLILS